MHRILWISRHLPQEAQIAELEEKFGEIEVVQRSVVLDNSPLIGAQQVDEMLREIEADDLVAVMPVAHLAALTRSGIQPLRAVMERRPTGRTLDNGEAEYEFCHLNFERVLEVTVKTERL